jgi:glutaminyl-peptide cyclotransferase
MLKMLTTWALWISLPALYISPPAAADVPVSPLRIVNTLPHNPRIFTQGLAMEHDRLYQSSGLHGRSMVIAGKRDSVEVSAHYRFEDRYFAEGLCVVGDEVLVLTWQAGELFVLNKTTLQFKRKLSYPGEGWGLAYDGVHLWFSDGSSRISRRDTATLALIDSIEVHDQDGPVRHINELEWAEGKLYANIWFSSRLIAIDPGNGAVTAQWNLDELLPQTRHYGRNSVANGIAYDPGNGHFWLTGKGWPLLYEVELRGRLDKRGGHR